MGGVSPFAGPDRRIAPTSLVIITPGCQPHKWRPAVWVLRRPWGVGLSRVVSRAEVEKSGENIVDNARSRTILTCDGAGISRGLWTLPCVDCL